ncbi:MAG: SANT/Myb domain-containing protein [Holosporaceae bacterium]|jgi:hypothetical protein|nr:SANT/Myb domain-containing protein [Holosporaceae bacterium]
MKNRHIFAALFLAFGSCDCMMQPDPAASQEQVLTVAAPAAPRRLLPHTPVDVERLEGIMAAQGKRYTWIAVANQYNDGLSENLRQSGRRLRDKWRLLGNDDSGVSTARFSSEDDALLLRIAGDSSVITVDQLRQFNETATVKRDDATTLRVRLARLRGGQFRQFTPEEDAVIIELQKTLGNRWRAIADRLVDRTEAHVRNRWNSYLKKQIMTTDAAPETTETPAAPTTPGLPPVAIAAPLGEQPAVALDFVPLAPFSVFTLPMTLPILDLTLEPPFLPS